MSALAALGLFRSGNVNFNGYTVNYLKLPREVRYLYDSAFENALSDRSMDSLMAELQRRKVLFGEVFLLDQVAANSWSDALVTHNYQRYTETELILYTVVARLKARSAARFF